MCSPVGKSLLANPCIYTGYDSPSSAVQAQSFLQSAGIIPMAAIVLVNSPSKHWAMSCINYLQDTSSSFLRHFSARSQLALPTLHKCHAFPISSYDGCSPSVSVHGLPLSGIDNRRACKNSEILIRLITSPRLDSNSRQQKCNLIPVPCLIAVLSLSS